MGIELPAELAEIARVTGVSWPEADEDALRTQAQGWRRAAQELTALARDADVCVTRVFEALSGPAAEAAQARWSTLGDADTGLLAEAIKGATEAADRLDHAAEQVGRAKVEIVRSEEHTSELQSRENLVCRLLLEKKKNPTSRGYRIGGRWRKHAASYSCHS